MVCRVLRTGTSLPEYPTATISARYFSNLLEAPVSSVALTGTPYFYVNVTNNLPTPQKMLVTVNIYDSNGVPIVLTYETVTPAGSSSPYSTATAFNNFNIPSWAHYGTATAYVDVFSDWPSNNGVPYAIESSFQFTITGSAAFSGTPSTTQAAGGHYNLSFLLPHTSALGQYTVFTTAQYGYQLGVSPWVFGSASTTFQVVQLGDLNADGQVNFKDIQIFVAAYIAYYTPPNYTNDKAIDFNNDGKINFLDVQLLVHYYLLYWSS